MNSWKRRILLLGFLLIQIATCFGQDTSSKKSADADNTLIQLGDQNGVGLNEISTGIPVTKGETLGTFYFSENWCTGVVNLFKSNGAIENLTFRYNEMNHFLEIKEGNKISAIDPKHVKSFALNESCVGRPVKFINAAQFKSNDQKLSGFLEVLVQDSISLMKFSMVKIKAGNYNEKLGYGDLNDRYKRESKYFLLKKESLIELPKNFKKSKNIFGNHYDAINSEMRNKELNWRNDKDIIFIFEYYNQLIK